jgi:CAAX protease family protein
MHLEKAPPPAWPVIVAYVAGFFLAEGASVGIVLAVAITRAGPHRERIVEEVTRFALSSPGMMASAFVDAIVLVAVAVVTARLLGKDITRTLRLQPSTASVVGICAAVGGMLGLGLACGAASELLGLRGQGVMDLLAQALRSPTPAALVIGILTIGISPGIAEETFFRGLIQTRLSASWGRWPAIAATSAAFGLIHLDPMQGVLAFVAGLFLGWTAERFAGVRPTIVAHTANNALFVAVASLSGGGNSSRKSEFFVLAMGAILFVASTMTMRSAAAVRQQ